MDVEIQFIQLNNATRKAGRSGGHQGFEMELPCGVGNRVG